MLLSGVKKKASHLGTRLCLSGSTVFSRVSAHLRVSTHPPFWWSYGSRIYYALYIVCVNSHPRFLARQLQAPMGERLLNKLSFEWPYWPSLGRQRAARLAAHPSPVERGLPPVCLLRTCMCTGRGVLWRELTTISFGDPFFSTVAREKERFFSTVRRASFFSTAVRKKELHFFSTVMRKKSIFSPLVHFFSTAARKRASFSFFLPLLKELHFFSHCCQKKRASFFSTAARKKELHFSPMLPERQSCFEDAYGYSLGSYGRNRLYRVNSHIAHFSPLLLPNIAGAGTSSVLVGCQCPPRHQVHHWKRTVKIDHFTTIS